jgi:hypothetical protein
MAKYDDKTRKVTVQKGDNPTKIAAFLRTKLKENVTTKQVQQAIGNRRIFTGTTFTFGKAKTLDGDTGGNKNNSGGGGGSSFIQPMPEVSTVTPPSPVRLPSRDVVSLVDAGIDSATIQNLLFENIGATELVKFTRHDTVDGINPYYDIISNLSDIKRKYDPASLISVQKPESSYFDIYTIKLDQKIPDQSYLDENNLTDYVYLDTNGNLSIELTNLASDEIMEVQIDSNGTIYEVGETE